ncbi:MAG: PP2C family protein-serine/threonine phosphatase [Neglectibacter sp.]
MWLNQPLFQDSFIRIWMAAAVGTGFVLAMILILVLIRKRKKKEKAKLDEKDPITEKPDPLPILELANLQGIGKREEQQDAFGISRMEHLEEDGLLAVLCDGMGGMAEGGMIAAETAAEMVGMFPWENDSTVADWIRQRSGRVYQQFRGHGGTTLVAALLRGKFLSFWCVGDSDLFLLRDGKLYALNVRQEYKNDLVLRALEGTFPVEEAFFDPQAGALSEYIGKEDVRCDYTYIPFPLQPEDVLLLCSDGVSDTLTLRQIRETMALSPQACCDKLEEEILAAGKPNQDNYTAIVLKYHGKGEGE